MNVSLVCTGAHVFFLSRKSTIPKMSIIIRILMNDSSTKNAFHFRISILGFHEAILCFPFFFLIFILPLDKFLKDLIRTQPAFYTLTSQDERFCFNCDMTVNFFMTRQNHKRKKRNERWERLKKTTSASKCFWQRFKYSCIVKCRHHTIVVALSDVEKCYFFFVLCSYKTCESASFIV